MLPAVLLPGKPCLRGLARATITRRQSVPLVIKPKPSTVLISADITRCKFYYHNNFMQKNCVQEGFTLVEMIIVIAIFSVLILVTAGILQDALFGSSQQFTA